MRTLGERWVALVILVAGLCVLGTARSLEPDPRGFGTHVQLGIAPCHFEASTGIPCPTCGMTTSFAHFAHGEPVKAFRVHPVGAFGFVIVCAVSIVAGLRVFSDWPDPSRLRRLSWRLFAPGFLVIWFAYWGVQVAQSLASGVHGP